MEIKGKNALITGSAAGIGQATAFALADAGAAGIALADLDEKGLTDTANIIEQKKNNSRFSQGRCHRRYRPDRFL